MTSSYFSLSCDTYKQIVFSGLTRQQEQQEFVDLTLAADGHIVKVHKNIMALVSPYIKELLKSTSSDNPVIFLNNVKHDVLNYLLEYIYRGEVNLPQDSIESFLQLSQSLHITGMGKQSSSKNTVEAECTIQNLEKSVTQQHMQSCPTTLDETWKNCESTSNVAASISVNNDHNFEVEQFENIPNEDNVYSNLNNDHGDIVTTADTVQPTSQVENLAIDMAVDAAMSHDPLYEYPNAAIENKPKSSFPIIQILSDTKVDSREVGVIDFNMFSDLDVESKNAIKMISQYTFSERGSVQIIVNRYLYCCHHSSRGGRKRRWRCAEYRKHHCRAYIDSIDNRIVSRKGLHSHGFHDDRIYKKHEKGEIFHSYEDAKEAWVPTK